jgi:protein tyrosine/serine phosphatase
MLRRPFAAIIAAVLVALSFADVSPRHVLAKDVDAVPTEAVTRPSQWATPVAVPGVPNLHRISDTFYRSAQPEAEGFKTLAKGQGVKTVVSLRAFHSDKSLLDGTDMTLVRVPIFTWNIDSDDVIKALSAIRRAEQKGPVLLHCQHGADRTGLVTALYRVLYQGWSKAAALDEMTNGKFGYHAVWGNIPRFLRDANIEVLRKQVEERANGKT